VTKVANTLNMSITLTPEQEKVIQTLLTTSQFKTPEEVIQAALNLLEEQHRSYQQWLDETRTKIDEGVLSLERGEGIDGETFVNELLGKLREAKKSHS
jgi:antitoxin ParD1/3/4